MVLIDTNIWIEFLKNNPEFFEKVAQLLKDREVVTLEPIFSELFFGMKNEREEKLIEDYWKLLPKVPFEYGNFVEAAKYASRNKFYTQGIGLIDALIIKTAVDHDLSIWTLDKKMISILEEKNIYRP